MGFLDLNGGLGRRFGSLGLSLDELATTLTAYPADQVSAEGPQSERVESFARQSLAALVAPETAPTLCNRRAARDPSRIGRLT